MHDELIKALRCCRYGDSGCEECPFAENDKYGLCANIISYASDAIEELQAQIPKWNPVSEPPREKGDYWCNVRSYNFDDAYYQHEVWFDGEFFVIYGVCTDRVTHWMPMPEPPKMEVGEDG